MRTLIDKSFSVIDRRVCDCQAGQLNDSLSFVDKLRYKMSLGLILLDVFDAAEKECSKVTHSRSKRFYYREMEQLTSYLLENIEKQISLQQMSKALHVSESTLRRLVHKSEGCAPITYFHHLKLQQAQKMLQTTGISVTEISIELGFSSIQYFSRVFKAKTGYSPTEYRKIWGD